MKQSDILACQIQEWYPRFHRVSLKTIIIPLPEPFVDFLLDDGGLFLPKTASNEDALPSRVKVTWPDLQAEEYHHWKEEDEEEEETAPNVAAFPDLEEAVRAAIQTLGSSVFPKLNWSAPKDAVWISTNGSLKCCLFSEIVLLLRASDSIVHDLCHAFDSCEDKSSDRPSQFYLAVRKWYDLRPEMEFRGFVKGGLLVGVSQREVTGFYPAMVEKLEEFESAVFGFFTEHVSGKFGPPDYTFDCYVTRDGRVRLIDFNPWGAFTLALLFTWDELERNHCQAVNGLEELGVGSSERLEGDLGLDFEELSLNSESLGLDRMDLNWKLKEGGHKLDFRVVEREGCVQPSLRGSSGVPYDYIDTSPGSAWDEFLRRADEEIKKQAGAPAAGSMLLKLLCGCKEDISSINLDVSCIEGTHEMVLQGLAECISRIVHDMQVSILSLGDLIFSFALHLHMEVNSCLEVYTFRRRAVHVLAFIAASGDTGVTFLLSSMHSGCKIIQDRKVCNDLQKRDGVCIDGHTRSHNSDSDKNLHAEHCLSQNSNDVEQQRTNIPMLLVILLNSGLDDE